MAVNNLRGMVLNASKVPLLGQVTVRGNSTYTFSSNLLSWEEANNFLLTTIAENFGQTVSSGGPDVMRFRCGDSAISTYDYGLLFNCFVCMTTAYAEIGSSVPVSSDTTTTNGISVVWFGNHGLVYSSGHNLIVPVKSADIQKACRYDNVQVDNFNDSRVFTLQREGLYLVLSGEDGSLLCKFKITPAIQRAFPRLFEQVNDTLPENEFPWDEQSQLGHLVSGAMYMTDASDTIRQYQERAEIESVVVRDDLIFKPTERYKSTEELYGSICYTDKDVVALAVNFRNNLFVYQPWFTGQLKGGSSVQVDPTPQFGGFYNVTEECKKILRYANSVTVVPLTAVEFDVGVFDKIKAAFFSLELPRIQLASAFGKVVIPEPVLLNGLASASGETAYCIVPVGAIGRNVICKGASGDLDAIKLAKGEDGVWEPWGFDTAFYDITGVL